jgi:hypothetical protein
MTIGEIVRRIIEREQEVSFLVNSTSDCQEIDRILEDFRKERENLVWQIVKAKSKDPLDQEIIYNQIFPLFTPCHQTL